MIGQARIDITLREAATSPLVVTLKDAAGAELDLSGWDVIAQVRETPTAEDPALSLTASVTGGVITLSFPVPNPLPAGKYVWDMILTNTSGEVRPVGGGAWIVEPGVAR